MNDLSNATARTLDEGAPINFTRAQDMIVQDAELDAALEKVALLEFSMLKRKLVEDSEWTSETVDEADDLYRKFLALNIRYPDKVICPTGPVDIFWHAHIIDTRAYADDCERLFGQYLHHFPYFGMRGAQDKADLQSAFESSRDLFVTHFGIDPAIGDTEARSCRPQRCWC